MKDPSQEFLGDMPYDNYTEYLEDCMMYTNLLLLEYLDLQINREKKVSPAAAAGFSELMKGQEYLKKKLRDKNLSEYQEKQVWERNIRDRREMSMEMSMDSSLDNSMEISRDISVAASIDTSIYTSGGPSGIFYKKFPLEAILYTLGLGDFERILLLLVLMENLDGTYLWIYRLITGQEDLRHVTLGLCARIYYSGAGLPEFEIYGNVLHKFEEIGILFPELSARGSILSQELVCDARLVELLLGKEEHLTRGVEFFLPDIPLSPLMFREEELEVLSGFIGSTYPMFLIYGEKGIGKTHLVCHFCRQNHSAAVCVDLEEFYDAEDSGLEEVFAGVKYAARECVLKTMPLVIKGLGSLSEKNLERFTDFVRGELKRSLQLIFLLLDREEYQTSIRDVYVMELKGLSDLERIQIWEFYGREYSFEEEVSFEELANTFSITPGQIINALKQAELQSGRNRPIGKKLLYRMCYAQLEHRLGEKTSRVKTDYRFEDLKLDKNNKEILKDICNCVKNKHIVLNEWNFSKIVPYGAGLTVLFSGPPGTGKTMASQVIANELNMELYKIDLSQIIDKYVGETEKNIRMIFKQAQKSNSILFFDEADSIFSKRLEATNANERFANIESSLLLQCIEEYSGISILATNNVNSIDAAFIRRFKYYILFREPDEQERYEIWTCVIPDKAPLSKDVDLRLLARQFPFTGAVIKNIALSAAYLAANEREEISILHILKSIKREMFKNNLILTKEKLGSLGYLFDEIN